MTDVAHWIERYYDRDPGCEWERLERHRTEFAVTMRALLEYLPPPPASVLDCGGGPGRYAIELKRDGNTQLLLRKGIKVTRLTAQFPGEKELGMEVTRIHRNNGRIVMDCRPVQPD